MAPIPLFTQKNCLRKAPFTSKFWRAEARIVQVDHISNIPMVECKSDPDRAVDRSNLLLFLTICCSIRRWETIYGPVGGHFLFYDFIDFIDMIHIHTLIIMY